MFSAYGSAAGDLGLVADAAVDGAPAGRMILSIEVPDVDAALPSVERRGGAVTGGPDDMPWGQRIVHTTDPDGNVVDLTTTRPSPHPGPFRHGDESRRLSRARRPGTTGAYDPDDGGSGSGVGRCSQGRLMRRSAAVIDS